MPLPFFNDFNNKKIVESVIDSLNIGTFDYPRCYNEYVDFISTRSFTPPGFGAPPLFYLAIHEDYKGDTKLRSHYAKKFTVKEFCVALELYNLCCNEPMSFHQLTRDFHFPKYTHFFLMASLHFSINFLKYLERISAEYNPDYADWNSLERLLFNFIKESFLGLKYPSFEHFIKYGVEQKYIPKSLKEHFKSLI